MTQSLIKNTLIMLLAVIAYVMGIAQPSNKQIIKVTYTSTPISQYRMTENNMRSTATKASIYEFLRGITDYYSLYINLKERSSIYVLDSSIQVRPIGWENPKVIAALSDTVFFALKSAQNNTYKYEWIMNQIFYSEGRVGDINWKLTNEEKTIAGLRCLKAIGDDNKYPMLTVWYTKDIPVSSGPSIYQGLPGLVVWVEDFFRTIEILQIEYSDDETGFNQLYTAKYNLFTEQKKRGKYYDKESLVMVKKGELANSLYKYYYGKQYRRED